MSEWFTYKVVQEVVKVCEVLVALLECLDGRVHAGGEGDVVARAHLEQQVGLKRSLLIDTNNHWSARLDSSPLFVDITTYDVNVVLDLARMTFNPKSALQPRDWLIDPLSCESDSPSAGRAGTRSRARSRTGTC